VVEDRPDLERVLAADPRSVDGLRRRDAAPHSGDDVTEALDKVYSDPAYGSDGLVKAAARRTLRRVEW